MTYTLQPRNTAVT